MQKKMSGFIPTLIRAEVFSDDRIYEIKFDAAKWFEQADPSALRDLASCEWGGDYPADNVAEFFINDKNSNVADLFDYLHRLHAHGKIMGFECYVNEVDALAWLQTHRPEVDICPAEAPISAK